MEARVLTLNMNMPRRMKRCKPEVEVFSWRDGTRVAYDPNSMGTMQLDRQTAKRIRQGSRGFSGLLFSEIAPDFMTIKAAPVRRLVFNVTHGCNLACTYCFARGYKKQPVMLASTAFRALELFDPKHDIDIAFFGGEPLVAWDTVMQTAERAHLLARQRGVGCKLHVTTNGALIDHAKAVALHRYKFSILISLDGPEDIHNAARPAKKGNSFEQTMQGMACLRDAGHRPPMMRATFADKKPQLIKRLNFFKQLYDKGWISGVSIEPAILSESCGATPKAKVDQNALAREWHAAAKWFVECVKEGRPFPFFYFRKLLKRLLNAEYHGTECGAGRGYLTIGPDGTMYACHRESGSQIGHMDSGFDREKREPWWGNRVDKHAECMKCWARYLCGGGCPQNRVEIGGAVDAPMPIVCAAKKAMMREVFFIAAQLTDEEVRKAGRIG